MGAGKPNTPAVKSKQLEEEASCDRRIDRGQRKLCSDGVLKVRIVNTRNVKSEHGEGAGNIAVLRSWRLQPPVQLSASHDFTKRTATFYVLFSCPDYAETF